MPVGLSKDIVFLVGGILLSFALESERQSLTRFLPSDILSLLCFASFVVMTGGYLTFRYYHNLLSAAGAPEESHRRQTYENLRASLVSGGTPATLYASWLERGLVAIEHRLGEEKPPSRSLIQHVIGLERVAALWTPSALDKCILFAFVYPEALLLLGWVVNGQAGPAEKVLGLENLPNPLPRYVTLGAVLAASYAYYKCYRILGRTGAVVHDPMPVRRFRFVLWFVVFMAGGLVIDYWLGHGPGAVGGSVILTSSVVGAVSGDVLIAMLSVFVGTALGIFTELNFGVFVAAIIAAVACVGTGLIARVLADEGNSWGRTRGALQHNNLFWWLFLAAAIGTNVALAKVLARSHAWPVIGPILLFYGLLPAINAPFLWFSVGMTRALLWLGLERKGWWPYFYALLDAAVAIATLVLLVAGMIVGIQLINLMAVEGGGKPLLEVAPLLVAVIDGLKHYSFKAEYWWIYTLLLSAMIPSLMNLAIGGFSLIRGIPILSRRLQAYLPEGHGVAQHDRNWISLMLSIQAMVGLCLASVSQFILLPWWIFGYLLPGLGFGVLQFAQQVERFDLPARILLR